MSLVDHLARKWTARVAVAAIGTLVCTVSPMALEPDAGKLLKCPAIQDKRARLACFDAAMNPSPTAFDPNAITTDEASSSTKEVLSASRTVDTGPPRVVASDDLYVAPGKYEGRRVETKKVKCFHADKNDYRCIGSGSLVLAVFAQDVEPKAEKDTIENDCGEVSKMAKSPRCVKTIRFIPNKHEEDLVNGYQKRVVIRASAIEIVPQTTARR